MHGLSQTSEETVSMAVDFMNGDIGMTVFCAAELSEDVRSGATWINSNLELFHEQRSQSCSARQFPARS